MAQVAAIPVRVTRTQTVWGWCANIWQGSGRVGSPAGRVGAAAILLVAAAVGVYLVVYIEAPTDQWCHQHEVGCGFGIHLTGTLSAGLLAYLFFYRLVTEPRVLLPILRAGWSSPAKLFRWLGDGTEYENPIGRKQFVKQLVDDVAHSRMRDDVSHAQIPHVIVGDGGSGKTTVLVAVAAEVTRRGMIPVALTLRDLHRRDATDLDFARSAKEAFVAQALLGRRGGRTISTETVEKVWRKLRPRVAVLVDDLEKVQRGREGLRAAFAAARAENLMLIATSRLDGIPPGLEASVVELDALSGVDAVEEILKCGQRNPEDHRPKREQIEAVVARAEVISTPYFMRLAMRLASRGSLPLDLPASRAGARLALLEAFYDTIRMGGDRGGDGLSSTDRDGILEDLERLACQSLGRRPPAPEAKSLPAKPRAQHDINQYWPGADPSEPVPEVIRIRNRERLVEGGERMGVIHAHRASDPRFTHQVLQAYFASRLLRAGNGAALRAGLLERNPGSPYLAMALVLAAAATPDSPGGGSVAVEVCDVLLRCAGDHAHTGSAGEESWSRRRLRLLGHRMLGHGSAPGAWPLHLITAAVEAAALAGPAGGPLAVRAAEMAAAALATRPERATPASASAPADDAATRRIKLQLIHELSVLGGEVSVNALWAVQGDPDYAVRWQAVLGITATDESRFAVVDTIASDAIAKVRAVPREAEPIDDNGPEAHGEALSRLKPVAWMLPALHSDARRGGRTACAERLEAHMCEIQAAANRSDQHGVLASLAQGFKLDAVRYAERPGRYGLPTVHERLFSLLDEVPFWYTRVVLLHAISLNLIAAAGRPVTASAAPPLPRAGRRATYLGPALSSQDAERRLDAFLDQGGLHPFVRAAGELCRDALSAAARGGSWHDYIWTDDEVEVIARPPRHLHPTALHLVADIALLLNLNDQNRSSGERARFGEHHELPACLRGQERARILDDHLPARQCLADCPFVRETGFRPLCPDRLPRWAADDASGAVHSLRRLNRSFCRRLRHTASHHSWTAASGEKLRLRERRAHIQQLREFWAKMEQRSSI